MIISNRTIFNSVSKLRIKFLVTLKSTVSGLVFDFIVLLKWKYRKGTEIYDYAKTLKKS